MTARGTSGRLGEGTHHELRIHGVAGTPPEGMLDDIEPTWPGVGPCGGAADAPRGEAALTAWRRLPRPGVRAWSWSSVTSGSARTALYLLLLPHVLVNLAGWAAPPTGPPVALGAPTDPARGAGVRAVAAGVRLLALGLTVIMAQWALLVGLDLLAYQWAVQVRGWPAAWLAVGVVGAGLVIELVLVVTRLRLPAATAASLRDRPLTDPVGHTSLTHDPHLLWSSPGTIALQRAAHHGVALGSIAVVGIAMVGGWVPMPQPWVGLGSGLGALAILLGVGAVLAHSLSPGRPGAAGATWPATASRAAGRLAVLVAAGAAAAARLPAAARLVDAAAVESMDAGALAEATGAGAPVYLPVIRDVGMALTVGYTLACLAVGAIAWLVRDRQVGTRPIQGAGLPGMALLGGAVGGGMGAAIAAFASRRLSGPQDVVVPGPLPEALAITYAALMVLLGWVLVVGLAMHADRGVGTPRVVLTGAVHRLLDRAAWLPATLTLLGVVGVGLITVLVRTPDNPLHVLQDTEPLPQLIVLVAAGMLASAVGLAVGIWRGSTAVGAGTAAVLLAGAVVAVLAVPAEVMTRQLRPAAMAIGLLTPAGFVLGKGISALRSTDDRRTIAILWDVGTFLPRWWSPLCPPTYGDRVVTDLQALVADQLAVDGGRPRRTLLLAPHSQGSVIAATAVLGLPEAVATDRLALLTYGSPLAHLHGELFPSLFHAEAFAALRDRLGGRWRNLARTSDPIGGPVGLPGVDVVLTEDPCGRGHSAYWREAAYDRAVAELQQALEVEIRLDDVQPQPRPG